MTSKSTSERRHKTDEQGKFVRASSVFRDWVSADGEGGYRAAPGRYHLYVSEACPWAHRAIIVRRLKRLDDVIGMTVVDPLRDERGWRFSPKVPDPINGFTFLSEAYRASDPHYAARVTVPILWDTVTSRIVNNESADIIRMLNRAFDEWGDAALDLYPAPLEAAIDELNAVVYTNVNNGVYKCGFARTQEAYEQSFQPLFATLDMLDERLASRRYLMGERITEADWRLFPTLVRFDAVYYTHFKCNLKRIADYPHLAGYLRELYQWPGVRETVNVADIKRHYFATHTSLNPTGIVPTGPELDFASPHRRGEVGTA